MATRGDIQKSGASFFIKWENENWNTYANSMAKKFQQLGNKINAIGRKMAIGSLIAAAPLIAAVRTYAAYSKQLGFISTMLDDSAAHMDRFSAGIRRMSVQFGQSTEAMSRGLYDILSAGFAPAQAMEMLAVTSKAAVAGMTDTKDSTQAIIAVLNSYSLSAEHAQEVSDSLFMAVRMGVLTFGELAGHIGMVSSTAASAGVTMDEMNATLAAITRGGIETSHAVVALNNVLKAFLSPTGASAEFARSLESMGLGPITTEGIRSKGFLNIMKEIAALSAPEIAKLFPSLRGLRGIMAFKANLAKIDEIYANFASKTGATDEAFEKMAETFGVLLDRIKQASVLILSYVGEALVGGFKSATVEILNVANGIGIWLKSNKGLVVTYAKMVFLIGKMGIGLMVVGSIMKTLAALTIVMTGGMTGLVIALLAVSGAWVAMEWGISHAKGMIRTFAQEGAVAVAGKDSKSGVGPFDKALGSRHTQRLDEARFIIGAMQRQIVRAEKAREEVRRRIRLNKAQEGGAETLWGLLAPVVTYGGATPKDLKKTFNDIFEAQKEIAKQSKVADRMRGAAAIFGYDPSTMYPDIGKQGAPKGASTTKTGFSLGYYHTPVLAYSSTAEANPELDALNSIETNTKDTIAAIDRLALTTDN